MSGAAIGGGLLIDVRPINEHRDTGLGVYSYHLGREMAARCLPRLTFIQAPRAAALAPDPPIRLRPPDFDLATDRQTLRTLAAAFGFDLMLSTFYPPPPSRRTPTIAIVQDLVPLRLPDQYRGTPVFEMYDTYLRASCRGAAHVITISASTRRDVIDLYGVPEARTTVVYPGADHYDISRGVPPPALASRLRTRPFLLAACSTEPRKNLRAVLAAHALTRTRLGAERPLLVLAGVGRGRRPEIEALVAAHDPADVVIAGRLTPHEFAWLYRHAQCFLFPSLYEGFGLPVVEAMRVGTPVVCANTTALPEVGGDAVCYVDPTSVEQMCEAIVTLVGDGDLRRDLARRGMAQADRFTWATSATEVLTVIASVLGRPLDDVMRRTVPA